MWVGPEIRADDTEARLFLSQYLTKTCPAVASGEGGCPVMVSRMSIERKDGSDVVCYTSDKGSPPLDFMAALSLKMEKIALNPSRTNPALPGHNPAFIRYYVTDSSLDF